MVRCRCSLWLVLCSSQLLRFPSWVVRGFCYGLLQANPPKLMSTFTHLTFLWLLIIRDLDNHLLTLDTQGTMVLLGRRCTPSSHSHTNEQTIQGDAPTDTLYPHFSHILPTYHTYSPSRTPPANLANPHLTCPLTSHPQTDAYKPNACVRSVFTIISRCLQLTRWLPK